MSHPVLVRCAVALLTVSALVACESRAHKELRQQHMMQKIEYDRVVEQMSEVWTQSLKARFPLIKELTRDPIQINLRYIKAIQFEPDPHYTNKWNVHLTLLPKKGDVHPNFIVYLFDRRGLNVAKVKVDPKKYLLKKVQLQAGVQTARTEQAELDPVDEPRFYWIRFLE